LQQDIGKIPAPASGICPVGNALQRGARGERRGTLRIGPKRHGPIQRIANAGKREVVADFRRDHESRYSQEKLTRSFDREAASNSGIGHTSRPSVREINDLYGSGTPLKEHLPGITVSPTEGLVTTEGSGTNTFTIVLNTKPTDDVTIELSSSDPTEGTISPTSLTSVARELDKKDAPPMPQRLFAPQFTQTGFDGGMPQGDAQHQHAPGDVTSARRRVLCRGWRGAIPAAFGRG
jgi:hypothetical protein